MFVEHKEAVEVTEAPAKLEDWQRILLKAADAIEKYGHVKEYLGDMRIGFCALGALAHAEPNRGQQYLLARSHLTSAVGGFIPEWNNDPERTSAEVIAKMRAVALGG